MANDICAPANHVILVDVCPCKDYLPRRMAEKYCPRYQLFSDEIAANSKGLPDRGSPAMV
jgi:hypothetical protein